MGERVMPNDSQIHVSGQFGSDDIEAMASSVGVTLGLVGPEDQAYSELGFEDALALGTWLIAQAIAGGARP